MATNESSISLGLSEAEAREKLKIHGRNEVKAGSGRGWWMILISQIRSPLVYVLLLASGVSFWLKDLVDAGVILVAVMVNTIFGFIQECKAERSMEALAKLLTPRARVKRGDEWQEIDATLLVPGDVVKLTIGWKVPADGTLIKEDGMFVNEAILTGESMAVAKKVGDEGFMGTVIEKGTGEMLVVKTGAETKIGAIAEVVKEKKIEQTPLQKRLETMTKQMALLMVVVTGIVFVYGWMTGQPLVEFLNTSVALAVAAIPEGLVVGLTVILAVGMNRILKRKAIVRGLMAAETLGSVSVICLDKTGTITEGKMKTVGVMTDFSKSVEEQVADNGKHDKEKMEWMISGAISCNDQRDPLEISMYSWAVLRSEKILGGNAMSGSARTSTIPFDHKEKYIATRQKIGDKVIDFVSGAPEVILEMSTTDDKKKWEKKFVEAGSAGYRMIALAMKERNSESGKKKITREDASGLTWLGLVLFTDPIRNGVSESLAKARKAGMEVRMITGDYKETAWTIAHQAGLVDQAVDSKLIMTGDDFLKLGASEKKQKIKESIVFARTSPEEKLEIVEVLQDTGETVAMMGDGVNDVPALKKADIGIVVEGASDLAREVADLILLDNNFMTILAAVEEGRVIFDNLRKVVLYLLSDAFTGIILILVSIYLGWPLPLLAAQILWINLISDGFPYMALTVEPKEPDLLSRKPLAKSEAILDKKRFILIGVISLTAAVVTMVVFGFSYFVWEKGLVYSRTVAFAMQGFNSLAYVFSSRNLELPIWKDNLLKNPLLIISVLLGAILQLLAVYLPQLQGIFQTVGLSIADWSLVFLGCVAVVGVTEGVKAWLN